MAERKIKDVLGQLPRGRKYEFPVERAIFMTVLHRPMVSGPDRAAEVWRRGYKIEGLAEQRRRGHRRDPPREADA